MKGHKAKYSRSNTNFGKNSFENAKARNLPLFSTIQIFFSGVMAIIGIVFFLIGSLFVFVFGMLVNFDDMKFSESDLITTEVEIISATETTATENDTPVYKYNYSYKVPSGEEYTDISYNTGAAYFKNDVVEVQYLKDNPKLSRIIGMRKGTFTPWILLFIAIFPIVGAVLSYIGFKKNLEYIKLVQYGKIAFGTYSHEEATGESVNKRAVIRFFFNFTDEFGKEYLASGKTHHYHRLNDEDKERLVYNPQSPTENVMIDALPGSVKNFFERNDF